MRPKSHKSVKKTCKGKHGKSGKGHNCHNSLHDVKYAHECHRDVKRIESASEDEDYEEEYEYMAKGFGFKCSLSSSIGSSSPSSPILLDDDQFDLVVDKKDMNLLMESCSLFQSFHDKKDQFIARLRIYNDLLKFHKSLKEDQVYLYRSLQDMDELYLRNTAAILRLGFCPCLVHQSTAPIGDRLMRIHRKLRIFDRKMEEICEVVKEPNPRNRANVAAILHVMRLSDENKSIPIDGPDDHTDIALPEVVWDIENPFIENLNIPKMTEDWNKVRTEAREGLVKVESKFREICLTFGVTRGPAESPSDRNKSFIYNSKRRRKPTIGQPSEEENMNEMQSNNEHVNDVEDNDYDSAESVASSSASSKVSTFL